MEQVIEGTTVYTTALIPQDKCNALIKEATGYMTSLVLSEDPITSFGFIGLNKQLAQLQAIRERITEILLLSITNKSIAQRRASKAKSDYSTDYATIMTTNEFVAKQSSKEKREAAAAVQTQESYTHLQMEEDNLAVASIFTQIISTLAKDLENKQELLLKQIDVIRMTLQMHPEMKEVWNPNV